MQTALWRKPVDGDLGICGLGARTPLGFDAWATAAAVRGAISAVAAHPLFIDRAGDAIGIACDAGLEAETEIALRIERMMLSAIEQALIGVEDVEWRARVAVVVGLPEPRPGLPADIADRLTSALARELGGASDVEVLQAGHAAGLMAMQAVASRVSSGFNGLGLAVGVDSYHDPETLRWLDETGRLMSAGNRNGFPPGEGAGACLIAATRVTDALGLPVLARLRSACTTVEPKSIRSGEVCVGEGLTAALRGVLDELDLSREAVTATYCDLNGERYRNEEFLYALLRTQEAFVDAHGYLHPADCWGDLGAAGGPLFASLAIAAKRRGYAEGDYPLLWCGSDCGKRTAVLLDLTA